MPKFSLQVTQAVKEEGGWKVTALATVLYGNRPPEPPEEVVFDVNGGEFERSETDPDSGIARSAMLLQPGGYVITAIRSRAGARDSDARRTCRFSIKEEREPTEDEKKTDELKAKKKLAEAKKELKEAQQGLKQIEPSKPKSRLKILHVYKRLSRLEVVLQRTKGDGKPEDGEISVLDFGQAGVVFGDAPGDFPFRKKKWGIVMAFLPCFEYSRRVTFFLPDNPDDPAAKAFVDVPARMEKKPERVPGSSLFQRMREAYSEERNKAIMPVFEIRRRQPLIFLKPQGGQDGR